MNKTDVSTFSKIMLPLRLPPEIYQKMRNKVNDEKEKVRGYSINQYITELIMEDLKKKK